jgi:hypothetical protein
MEFVLEMSLGIDIHPRPYHQFSLCQLHVSLLEDPQGIPNGQDLFHIFVIDENHTLAPIMHTPKL